MRKHVSNREMRGRVNKLLPFENARSSVFSEMRGPHADGESPRYVVFSYGEHFPMYIHIDGTWYGNSDKFSRTTTNHQSCARPDGTIVWVDSETMKGIAAYGVGGLVRQKVLEAA